MTGTEIVLAERGRSHLDLAREEIRRRGLKRVGFESGQVSVDELERWKGALPVSWHPPRACWTGCGPPRMRRGAGPDAPGPAHHRTRRFESSLNFIRPGLTERDVAARLVYELLRRGGRKVSLDPIVAAGGQRFHAPCGAGRDGDPARDVCDHGFRLCL